MQATFGRSRSTCRRTKAAATATATAAWRASRSTTSSWRRPTGRPFFEARGCPAGTREPDRVVQFMQPGCDTMRIESDNNPSVTYPACLGDEDAFWADPLTHACVDHGWDIWCDIHDPTGWGGETSSPTCAARTTNPTTSFSRTMSLGTLARVTAPPRSFQRNCRDRCRRRALSGDYDLSTRSGQRPGRSGAHDHQGPVRHLRCEGGDHDGIHGRHPRDRVRG